MSGLLHVQLELIRWLQPEHAPAIDALFRTITSLGGSIFYLLLFPLILWCVDYGRAAQLLVLFFVSEYVNFGLKQLLAQPRPFALEPGLQRAPASGYGLPSGHAQNAVIVWGRLASWARWRHRREMCVAAVLAIGLSRVYLGVHFPTDVLAGWAVGGVLLGASVRLHRCLGAWVRSLRLGQQLLLAVLAPLPVLLLARSAEAGMFTGLLIGAVAGLALNARFLQFCAVGTTIQKTVRYAFGTLVSGLWYALALQIPPHVRGSWLVGLGLQTFVYAGLGAWLTYGSCWMFRAIGLAPAVRSRLAQAQR